MLFGLILKTFRKNASVFFQQVFCSMCQNLVLYMLPRLHNRMSELVEWLLKIFFVLHVSVVLRN